MTTTDLHQHFKVEYDKANVISAYPSFLPEEIDIWLNKANNMLVSQKFTGNNTRRVAFEGDTKRISDLQGLIKNVSIVANSAASFTANAILFDFASIGDYLFYIVSTIKLDGTIPSEVILVSHEAAKKVTETAINKPWIPRPVATIAGDKITIYYDTEDNKTTTKASLDLVYVKKPDVIDVLTNPTAVYELSDNVAYEMINLAVLLALENIESPRQGTKLETITLQE